VKLQAARDDIRKLTEQQRQLDDEQARNRLTLTATSNAYQSARSSYNNWISTRTATSEPAAGSRGDPAHAQPRRAEGARTRDAKQGVEALDARLLASRSGAGSATPRRSRGGSRRPTAAYRGGALFKQRAARVRRAADADAATAGDRRLAGGQKRGSDYWPLMRGFVLFAIFTFFFELVPYLPSYGGYVRYGVGIVSPRSPATM